MKKEFDDKGILIKKYKYWSAYLSEQQYYLGKCRIILNKKKIDLCELDKQEQQELFKILKQLKKALTECFHPDLFNYATLGNCIRHHHWHLIPRYKSERKIGRLTFKDKNWNKPPWPYPKKKVNEVDLNWIVSLIQKKI